MEREADGAGVDNLPLVDRLASAAVLAPAEELAEVAERIDEAFHELERPERHRLVAALAARGEREAAEAWVRLTAAHAPCGRLDRLPMDGFLIVPRHAQVLFPAVLDHLGAATHRADVVALVRAYCRAHALTARRLAPYAAQFLGLLADLDARVRDQAAFGGRGWRWQGDYPRARAMAGDLLDVLGHLPAGIAVAPLREALALPDPLLRLHAVSALWRLEQDVPTDVLTPLVADPETRAWTWECCVAAQRPGHVPSAARTPLRLAASAVATWCAQPWLLGSAPEDVQLVATARVEPWATGAGRLPMLRADAWLGANDDRAEAPADDADDGWAADDDGANGAATSAPGAGRDAMEWWYLFHARAPAGLPSGDEPGIAALAGPLPPPDSGRSAVPAFVATLGERWHARTPRGHFARLLEAYQPFPDAPPCR